MTVKHGEVVAIQFMRGVYASDAVTSTQKYSASTNESAQSTPSIAQLRDRVRARIDATKMANARESQ